MGTDALWVAQLVAYLSMAAWNILQLSLALRRWRRNSSAKEGRER